MNKLIFSSTTAGLLPADDHTREHMEGVEAGTLFEAKPLSKKKTRRNVLNNYSHAIYRDAARMLGENTMMGEKAYCKFNYGIPVLLSDPVYGERYQEYFDLAFRGLSYEEKLQMLEFEGQLEIRVTSLMDDEQMSKYLTDILNHYAMNRGIAILTPAEREFIKYPESASG